MSLLHKAGAKTDQCFCNDDEARNVESIFTEVQDLQSAIPFQHLHNIGGTILNKSE
jgi:hypothetical protein